MARDTLPSESQIAAGPDFEHEKFEPATPLGQSIVRLLEPLASLKLTVALFAMAIFLIFTGTLAQVDRDIWEVMGRFFRTWFAYVEWKSFFPHSFFPPSEFTWVKDLRGGFYFPGGFIIGGGMMLNLLAAHGLRFKPQAKGTRLWAGVATILLGILATTFVVLGGGDKDGLQDLPLLEWSTLWQVFKWGLASALVGMLWGMWRLEPQRKWERWGLGAASLAVSFVVAYIFYEGEDAALSASSLRILWQLLKGGLAGAMLLAGCVLVFKKRAGVVLLHAGIGLMLANELVVHTLHEEGQMHIKENETVNYVQDIRKVELAVIDPAGEDVEAVTVVPQGPLLAGKRIEHADLPFDVELDEFLQNSDLRAIGPMESNPATSGTGLKFKAEPVRAAAGADSGGDVDVSSAYVSLYKQGTQQKLGTYLMSVATALKDHPEQVEVDGKTYNVFLRFKRTYKPYSMHLIDVRFDKYMGTNTPKNYSSELQLVDPSRNVNDRRVKIWMNNPLRYAGETFYQSTFNVDPTDGVELTGLQVVTNTGWMIPSVACMIVALGMLAHFVITLTRFLGRMENADARTADAKDAKRQARKARRDEIASAGAAAWIVPLAAVLIFGAYLLSKARVPRAAEGQMKISEFGQLPLVYQGRAKPFDTLARNSLQVISDGETFVDGEGKTQPAIRWLLDVIARPSVAIDHKVVRIQNMDVLSTLGLERRKGFRYAISEFNDKMAKFEEEAGQARDKDAKTLSVYEKKLLELDSRLRTYMTLMTAFDQPRIRDDNPVEDLMRVVQQQQQAFPKMQLPLAVPPAVAGGEWEPYAAAYIRAWAAANMPNLRQSPNEATISMNSLLVSYAKNQPGEFNKELDQYASWLKAHEPQDINPRKVKFEAFFNGFQPFKQAMVMYVAAFVMVCVSWLAWRVPLSRGAFWLLCLALALHTFALVGRIYISGRPPVTNLYSSAVFIGWGCVVLCLLLEMLFRLGIGSALAATSGFATLLIASFLAGDGDTFTVLQAVLDTQFWLATHVTCITFGYATTYVAGLLGIAYILGGLFSPARAGKTGTDISRMLYGTLCFSIFFSFVGTVLGGLWADDSWGRFWGWDPKENGALIIVLWNALVLHARWDGMVKERGLAVLAVAGNIAVSWSWFGVNELGAGLHSYGFTEGVALALGVFALSQLGIIGLGLVPKQHWRSLQASQTA